jgi:Uma2 family endonuclease
VRKDRSSPGGDPMGHSPLHAHVVTLLNDLKVKIENANRHMRFQLPVACPPDGAPEPDASIIRGISREYLTRLPGKGDVFCVIEAAHSSIGRDREDKLPVYAAAGVPQYLIINLANNTVEIFEDPDPAAEQYRTKSTAERGEQIQLRVGDAETFQLNAGEILP